VRLKTREIKKCYGTKDDKNGDDDDEFYEGESGVFVFFHRESRWRRWLHEKENERMKISCVLYLTNQQIQKEKSQTKFGIFLF
jgi:hypothetical protein